MSWQKDNIHLRVGIMLLLTLLDHVAFAQGYPLARYTKENGLPSNMVYDVYRDSQGFMWVGTDKGVARFNGVSFQTFTTEDGLPDNEVFFFQEDYENRVWLATYSGALCYYKNGIFHHAQNTPFLKTSLKPDVPIHITVQKDSSILVYYSSLKGFINIKDRECNVYTEEVKDRRTSIPRNIYKISDSVYSFRYAKELCYLNVHTGASCCNIMQNTLEVSVCQNREFLFNNEFIYDIGGKKVTGMPVSISARDHINRIYFDGKNYLVATDDGICINGQRLLKGRRVPSATQDIAGCYWLPTLGEGIYRIDKDFEKSRFIRNAYTGAVTYTCSYKGTLYFATTDRRLYELKNDAVKLLLDFSEGIPNVKNQGNHVDCAINKHLLYCLGRKGTIFVYDLVNRNVRRFELPKELKKSVVAGKWKYFIATASGLSILSSNLMNTIPYASFDSNTGVLHVKPTEFKGRTYAMALDDQGNLLHSRPDGIYITPEERISFQSQYGGRCFIWLRYHSGTLAGCTPANELFLFSGSGKDKRTDSFRLKDVIWGNAYPLFQDQLLLTSNKHYYVLSLRTPAKQPVRLQPLTKPFLPAEAECIFSDTGSSYFFKNGDITIVGKEELLRVPPMPSLFFDKIIIGDSIFRFGNHHPELRLTGRHATVARITFDVLAFDSHEAIYEYCIAQDDNKASDWQLLTNREVNLLLPQYGTIKIFARAKNHEGLSSAPIGWMIVIPKPWWARWWGITLIILLSAIAIAGLFYFIIKWVIKRKEKEHHAQIRVLNAEFRSLNAMMNPHFIFNTLNNIQGFINADNQEQTHEYIRTFSDMIRQNMVNISKEMITLADEMAVVERYLKLQQLRFRDIAYDIVISPVIDLDEVMVPPLLLQPLVENSIKHGILPKGSAEGFIQVVISGTDDDVIIEVTDNGVGISRSATRNESFALEALKKRVDAISLTRQIDIRFDISDHTCPPYESGTRVVLAISYRS